MFEFVVLMLFLTVACLAFYEVLNRAMPQRPLPRYMPPAARYVCSNRIWSYPVDRN
jgi:hypothetical protein